jgi:RNA polymerase sigma-70 factor (ECF subfamily)
MVIAAQRIRAVPLRTARPGLPEAPISVPTPRPIGWSEIDEDTLLQRCVAGEREALAELYRRHKGEALRFIRHAVRNTQDADDILQEVFVEVSRSLPRFEGRAAFSTWLHRICVRTAVRHMKRRYRQVGEQEVEPSPKHEPADHRPGPDDHAATRDRAQRVRALLEKIAPKKRMVLVLHDLEGVSPKEISALVGAPVLTVRTRLFYARKELAALAAQDPALAEFFADEGNPDALSA